MQELTLELKATNSTHQ